MIFFRSDYSLGAHPKVMDALVETNMVHTDGYCLDDYSDDCAELIRQWIGKADAHVHYFVGGTPCNTTTISAALRPYEGVITPATGHIYVHETGSIELNGHRQFGMPTPEGKLRPSDIETALIHHEDEHCVIPKLVYITHPTESGGVYTKAELEALSECCRKNDLILYMDGARLGTALTWPTNDLTIKEIANLVDAFYIGGTKLGALFGEALVLINHEKFDDHFRYMIKRQCALLAKGRLIPVQLKALLEGGEDSLYFKISKHENQLAIRLAEGIQAKGFKLWLPHQTNQVFPIIPKEKIKELEKDFFFYTWTPYDDECDVIRLVTNWNSTEEEIDAFINAL